VPSFEAAARSLKVVPITAPVHSDVEIEAAITAVGGEPGSGLVVISDAFTNKMPYLTVDRWHANRILRNSSSAVDLRLAERLDRRVPSSASSVPLPRALGPPVVTQTVR
jgi:hypothetical protein